MDNYLINDSTLLIMPLKAGKSKVIEKYITYEINQPPLMIIEDSCRYYGSSYAGRCAGTEYLTGIKYKCPIIISELSEIIFFPTESSKNVNTIWINYHAVKKYFSNDENLYLELVNGQKILLNISNRVLSNQILKSSRLESILKSKKH